LIAKNRFVPTCLKLFDSLGEEFKLQRRDILTIKLKLSFRSSNFMNNYFGKAIEARDLGAFCFGGFFFLS